MACLSRLGSSKNGSIILLSDFDCVLVCTQESWISSDDLGSDSKLRKETLIFRDISHTDILNQVSLSLVIPHSHSLVHPRESFDLLLWVIRSQACLFIPCSLSPLHSLAQADIRFIFSFVS